MMILLRKYVYLWGFAAVLVIAGCQSVPDGFFQPVSLSERLKQTRVYRTDDEIKVLSACSELLLDNGFRIAEVESRLGWIDANKYRVRASVVTRPLKGRSGAVAVRVIFHYREKPPFFPPPDKGAQFWTRVDDAAIYYEFFSKLSKALYLEAQRI